MAWNSAKPALNDPLVSADVRGNFVSIEAAIGNPDTTPLAIKASTFSGSLITSSSAAFGVAPTYKPGTAATYDATVSGRIYSDVTQYSSSSGGGETTFGTKSISPSTLGVDGQYLRLTANGTLATNTNNKNIRAYFGATKVFDSGVYASVNGGHWRLVVEVFRKSGTAQRTGALGTISVPGSNDGVNATAAASPGETLANAVTFKVTGQGTAAGDVIEEAIGIEVLG